MCDREKEVSASLRLQVEEVQGREDEVKREVDRLRRERDRQEERNRQLETETHRRYSAAEGETSGAPQGPVLGPLMLLSLARVHFSNTLSFR